MLYVIYTILIPNIADMFWRSNSMNTLWRISVDYPAWKTLACRQKLYFRSSPSLWTSAFNNNFTKYVRKIEGKHELCDINGHFYRLTNERYTIPSISEHRCSKSDGMSRKMKILGPGKSNRLVWSRNVHSVATTENSDGYIQIYKFRYIRYVRVLSRFKIYQTALTVLLFLPLYKGYIDGNFGMDIALLGGFGMTSACVLLSIYSYFAMKLIGELQISKAGDLVKVSSIDFFGKRRNFVIPLDSISSVEIDPYTSPENINVLVCKFEFTDKDDVTKKMYYSLRYGIIQEYRNFGILAGSHRMTPANKNL